MQNKNKGITLIALIITIIVMLILVAVSVNIVIKSKLIEAAEEAVNKYKIASEEESSGVFEIDGKKYNSIEDYMGISTITIKMEVTHEDTAVTADGTKIQSIEHEVPIPVGYKYVEGEKNTGVVIEDETTKDQFVWVPVLQNQKIKIEVTAEDEITSIELLDPTGTKITTKAPTGKTYTESVNPTKNGKYTVTVKTANNEKTESLSVKSLYAQDIEYAEAIKQDAQQYTDSDISTHKDSVNKYGGFYIARYEAGSANKRTSSSGTTDKVLSQANQFPYNYISQTESIEKAATINNEKTNVVASLINSAVWDRTLNWLEETKAVTRAELFDSTSWGNYSKSQFNFKGKYSQNVGTSFDDVTTSTQKPENSKYLLGTGVTEYTKKNNIYDLAGNCLEWTMESSSSNNQVGRGR